MLLTHEESVKTIVAGGCEFVTCAGELSLPSEAADPESPVVIDGIGLTCGKVRDIARGGVQVAVDPAGLERARLARDVVRSAVLSRPVYGRTTGVGANRAVDAADQGHGLRLLRSHAGGAGPMLGVTLARAMLVVRLNQLAAGGSGVDPALLSVLAEALNRGLVPPVRTVGAIGTGDLGALASTALSIIGEGPWQGGTLPPFPLDPADAPAFMSSNAATIGEAAVASADLPDLLGAGLVVAALSFLAVRGSSEPYAAAVQRARPHPGQGAVAARMRQLLAWRAALGTAVLSRGMEEQADFSTQAARSTTETVAACRIVVSCELVAAVRALRMQGVTPAPGPLRAAYDVAAGSLDARTEDRPLDADIDTADRLLTALTTF